MSPTRNRHRRVLGIHGKVRQQPEVFEDVVTQVLGLVDDEHGELLGLVDEAGDLGADGAVGGGARAFGGQAELPGDGLVHVEDIAGGEGDVVDTVLAGVQGGGDVAAHGGFARADLAGDAVRCRLQLDEVVQAGLGLAPSVGLEQLVGVGGESRRGAG